MEDRKAALLEFSDTLDRILQGKAKGEAERALAEELEVAVHRNPWFTPSQMRISLSSLREMLQREAIDRWVAPYEKAFRNEMLQCRSVLLIMAGNIPFVGVQDVLAVLLSGHNALIKASSKDDRSLPRLLELLESFPAFSGRVRLREGPVGTPDAVIATGSDNTGRYFSYYFGHLPHTFRGNRSGVAVLKGDEDEAELKGLLRDVCLYFGRGCRNVTKLYVPDDWDPSALLDLTDTEEELKEHQKYMNNYAYHKAIYLMNGERFYDGGSLLLKADSDVNSPLGTLFYEAYRSKEELEQLLNRDRDRIQCLVGRDHIPFGKAQFPDLGEHEAEKDPLDLLAGI
ncbi:MAG: acyl-CoA reductase [Flavobacteriales bacterium]